MLDTPTILLHNGDRPRHAHQLRFQVGVRPNYFQRFHSDVGLVETDTYPRTVDPLSLAATKYGRAETCQHKEKLG